MTRHRLLVTGASAAGKTTLAKELGAYLRLPVKHLDSIAYVDERWTPRASKRGGGRDQRHQQDA
jgi:adenylate kinase family enzyme